MPGSRYEDFKRNYAFSIYDFKLHGHPRHKKRCPWGHGIFYFGRPFLGFREKVLKRNTSILHFFTQSYPYLGQGEGGHEINNFLPPYLTDSTYQIWLTLLLDKKSHDGQRRTPTHSNRSPEWLRWPKKQTLMNRSVCFNTINIVVRNWLGYGLI